MPAVSAAPCILPRPLYRPMFVPLYHTPLAPSSKTSPPAATSPFSLYLGGSF